MAAVITDPQSSARNVIQSTGDFTELTLRASGGQTVPIFVVENASGNDYFSIPTDAGNQGSVFSRPTLLLTTAGRNNVLAVQHTSIDAAPVGQLAGIESRVIYSGGGTLSSLFGMYTSPRNGGVGTITTMSGLLVAPSNVTTGIITEQRGVDIQALSNNGTIGTAYGVYVSSQGGAGVTTAIGLRVLSQTGAGTNIAMQIGAGNIGFHNVTPKAQQTGASAVGIAAIIDINAKAAVSALQTALANYGLVTSPA
jgi:hypothetical protein